MVMYISPQSRMERKTFKEDTEEFIDYLQYCMKSYSTNFYLITTDLLDSR